MTNDDQAVSAEPAVFAAENRVPWSALAPYAEDDAAEPIDHAVFYRVTLAGHEWVSDRHILIRAELLSGVPMNSQHLATPEGLAFAHENLQLILDRARVAGSPPALNPFHVALADQHGWTLEPAERLWRIVLDGAIVGAVMGLREPEDGGRRPGDDLSRVRVVVGFLSGDNPQSYLTAARIIDELDAHDRNPDREPPKPPNGLPVHNHGPEEGAGTHCPERHLRDGSLRGACIPTDVLTRTWTPDRRNDDGSTTLKVKRCCSGCGERIGDPTQEELDALVSGAPLPSTTEEHGCQR